MNKNKILNILGWLLLGFGLLLYVVPLFFEITGHYSGLIAFGLIFVGPKRYKLHPQRDALGVAGYPSGVIRS